MKDAAVHKWASTELGDVIDIVMGQAPAGKDCNKTGEGTPFVKTGEFGELRPVIREWTTDPKRLGKATDVFISVVGATCGKINLGADCAIGRSVAALRPKSERLDQFFLHYFMEGQVERLRGGSLGAAQTVISKEMLARTSIPLPPLEDQRRIVAVLDEAFAGLARARANAEANLADARELFDEASERLLQATEANWQKTTVEEAFGAVSTGPFGAILHKSDYVSGGVPIVNPAHIQNGRIVSEHNKTVSEKAQVKLASYRLQTGDLVVGRRGEMGRCAVVGEEESGWICGTGSFFIRPNGQGNMDFLSRLLRSRTVVKTLENLATGATVQNISNKALSRLEVCIPNEKRQKEIVLELDEIFAVCDQLAERYAVELRDLNDLRQSLLQKAFSGGLS